MALFALTLSISPGPVNLISLSSGLRYGFGKTFPFVSGATIGFTLLLIVLGLGLGSVASRFPMIINLAGIAGSLFLAYIGYQIAVSPTEINTSKQSRIPTFSQGFVLQCLNPKAWIACIAGISAFKLGSSIFQLMVFSGLYFVICYLSISSWALLGAKASALINSPAQIRWFNRVIGMGLIIVALYLIWTSQQSYLAVMERLA